MGIDPGTIVTGYGIITVEEGKMNLNIAGTIQLGKQDADHAVRLKKIFDRVLGLIEEYQPGEMAIEAPFFGKNVQSMLKLGRAQGVAMAAALYKNLPVYEYAPRKIKLAVTGRGNASKEQVLKMLENIFKQPIDPLFMDASDGLAAAVCHAYQSGKITGGVSIHKPKAKSGWNAYLSAHPEKIKGKKP